MLWSVETRTNEKSRDPYCNKRGKLYESLSEYVQNNPDHRRLVLEQMRSMGDRRSRTHGRRNGRRFSHHLLRCSRIAGIFHVQYDTVWTLRRKGDSHGHELFV